MLMDLRGYYGDLYRWGWGKKFPVTKNKDGDEEQIWWQSKE
jgi:hypothetical protein